MNKYTSLPYRLTDIYISLMLLVFPLFTGFQGYANITESKFYFFGVLTGMWAALLLVFRILERRPLERKPEHIIAVVFALWQIVSWIVSPYKSESLLGSSRYDGLITQLLYVSIFLGITTYGKWNKKYVYLLSASALGCTVVALMQIAGSSILFPNEYTYYDAGIKYISKFLGTIGNTNLLAAYLCICIPTAAAAAAFKYRGRIALCVVASLGGLLLSFTESAGGMVALLAAAAISAPKLADAGVLVNAMGAAAAICLGLAGGAMLASADAALYLATFMFVLCIAAAFVFNQIIPVKKHFKAVLATLVICFAAGFVMVYFWSGSDGAVYELSQLLHGHAEDDFGSNRIRIWRETLALVPESLIFGGGPDTLSLRLELEFTRYFPELGKTLSTYVDNAHNVYLGYLVNSGIPALAAYLALIGITSVRIFKCRMEHVALLGCALFCALSENFFGLGLSLVSPVMWVIWGLIFTDEQQRESGVINDECSKEKDNHIFTDICDAADVHDAG